MNYRLFLGIGLFVLSLLIGAPFGADAAEKDIRFPVAELGNCESKEACKQYCEIESHIESCVSFAEKNGLMSKDDAAIARKLGKETGPGGCRGTACRDYCAEDEHADECLAFAEEHDLMNPEELKAARQVLKNGGPGGCRNEAQCKSYCDDPANMDECLVFAEKHNLMPKEELEMAKKMAGKTGPGGCRGSECKEYCEDSSHMEECIAFAHENGMMSDEDYERAKKFAGKTGPGGCRGAECKTYCENPDNLDACISFAEENGMMSSEEVRRARLPGPGGCRGPACKTYCDAPERQEECMQWAVDNNMVSPEEAERFKNRRPLNPGAEPLPCRGEECRAYCENPENREACARAYGPADDKPDLGRPERGYEGRMMERRDSEGDDVEPPCATEEECRKLHEKCRANPERCNQRFGDDDESRFQNMSEEERKRMMEERGDRREGMRDADGRNPYRPEGVPPPEAYRRPPEGANSGLNPDGRMMGEEGYREGGEMMQGQYGPPDGGMMPPPEDAGSQPPPPAEPAPTSRGPIRLMGALFHALSNFVNQ